MAQSRELGSVHEMTLPQGRIRYRERGEGPPVVFVHGLLVNADLWRAVVPAVAEAGRLSDLHLAAAQAIYLAITAVVSPRAMSSPPHTLSLEVSGSPQGRFASSPCHRINEPGPGRMRGSARLLSENGPMARSDLILALVRAGANGDQTGFRRTVEALVAEERARKHEVLVPSHQPC